MSAHDADGGQFPALEAFFLGYLHQDFVFVHGDAMAAMEAFMADADPEDQRLLAREWRRLRASLADADEPGRLRVVARLGAAWSPATWEDLVTVFDRLAQAVADRESC